MSRLSLRTGRLPGQFTRESLHRMRMRCLLVLGVFAVATDALGRLLGFRGIEFELAQLGLLCVCLLVLRLGVPVVERLDQGASGEELVGGLLDRLTDEGWHVLHDARLGHGNVDHIAVGLAGVFTVETKSHPGPVRVRRVHGATIRQAQLQRERLQAIVGTAVEPLLVYSSAWVDRPGARRKGVRVLPARMLLSHLRHRPPVLAPDQVQDVLAQLDRTLAAGERRRRSAA